MVMHLTLFSSFEESLNDFKILRKKITSFAIVPLQKEIISNKNI
jgi:hypothetical protein